MSVRPATRGAPAPSIELICVCDSWVVVLCVAAAGVALTAQASFEVARSAGLIRSARRFDVRQPGGAFLPRTFRPQPDRHGLPHNQGRVYWIAPGWGDGRALRHRRPRRGISTLGEAAPLVRVFSRPLKLVARNETHASCRLPAPRRSIGRNARPPHAENRILIVSTRLAAKASPAANRRHAVPYPGSTPAG